MSVKVYENPFWEQQTEADITKGLLKMAVDIRNKAVILAPVDTGALKNSANVSPISKGYRIQFGSSRVPYARKRHFENKKNPQTLSYLEKAGDGVVRGDTSKYFKDTI